MFRERSCLSEWYGMRLSHRQPDSLQFSFRMFPAAIVFAPRA